MPPLWHHLFWRVGLDVPPPLFMGFGRTALLMGGFFGATFPTSSGEWKCDVCGYLKR